MGTVAQVLALLPHSKKVMASIPASGAVGSRGQVLPRPSVLRWAISRAFLCGVCMFTRGFLHQELQQKNMQKHRTLSCPSMRKTHGSRDLCPGRHKGCPLLLAALEEGQSRMAKCRGKIHCDLFGMHASVCVCVCACACACPVSPL